ncbi:MAG: hypothetical protein PHU51_03265 [Candidatus Nanoarchaeia archaeon]|nr:hypothetical protein [Candidatus Nanoarchaeia archaeon]
MKTKILLALFLLILSTSSVTAISNLGITETTQTIASNVVYGSSSDLPYMISSFKIHKGWNLIPSPGEGVAHPHRQPNQEYMGYDRTFGCGINELGESEGYYIKYNYIYIPNKGYIGGKVSEQRYGFYNSDAKKELETYFTSEAMGGEQGVLSYMITSQWVYSDNDCEYAIEQVALRDIEKYHRERLKLTKINKGWNFIYITPGFYNSTISEYIGDCEIISINQWNPISQKWQYGGTEAQQHVDEVLNQKIDDDLLYAPLIIKVAKECTFGANNNVPEIPALPN